MNVNTRVRQFYHPLGASIATAVTFFLLALMAPIGESVLAQSKAKSRQKVTMPSSKANQPVTVPVPDSEMTDEDWVGLAISKLFDLTAQEAPELMEALEKAPEIDYHIKNKPDCPVTITSARIKGLKIDWLFESNKPGGPPVTVAGKVPPPVEPHNRDNRYLIIRNTVTLKNKTNRPIADVSLTSSSRNPVTIQPNGVATRVLTDKYTAILMGEPSVEVLGVEFKDGKIWGRSQRVPPPPPPPPPPGMQPRIVKVEPPKGPPEIRLVRRSEQELRVATIKSVEPSYSQGGKSSGSAAIIQLIIAPTGKVACAIFLSGPESMREAVIKAAQQWRFKPTPGMAVIGVITINSK